MYYLNKIVGAFLNPVGIGLLLLLLATAGSCGLKRLRWFRTWGTVAAFVWLWGWSTGVAGRLVGLPLEREFPPRQIEELPSADAIVVLGGGTLLNTNVCPYAKASAGVDRACHGARLYKAGKAPRMFVTCEADARFLTELGVPREAITINDRARNTEEEARLIAKSMIRDDKGGFVPVSTASGACACGRPRVLLVTSAWHMRRALFMYELYAKGIEVVPAATDYMNMTLFASPLSFQGFVPDPALLGHNSNMLKEWIGYYGYYFLR